MDLRTLIETCRGDRSLQALADASRLSKPTWQTHAAPAAAPSSTGRRIPDAATIIKIAEGLRVDPSRVMLAIGETLGVIPPDRPTPELIERLPPAEVLDRLSPEGVDAVVRLIWLLTETNDAPPRPDAAALEAQLAAARRPRTPGKPRVGGGQTALPVVPAGV